MDAERDVIDRLNRIERLDEAGAPAADLLAEVRALLHAAERLAGGAADDVLDGALARCRSALAARDERRPAADLELVPAVDRGE